MKSLTLNKEDWLDYTPDTVPERDNYLAWQEELTIKDLSFWDNLLNNLTLSGDYVRYLGKTKRITYNVYNTILSDPTWKTWQKKQLTTYVMQKFKSIDNFNQFVKEQREAIVYNNNGLCFFREGTKFNIFVSFHDKLDPKVYILNSNLSKQVTLLCSLHDNKAKKLIFNYIKLNLSLECMQGVKSEQKVYDTFLDELSRGYHRINVNPVMFSNDTDEYCFTYIALKYDKIGKTEAWDQFLILISNKKMQIDFMRWIYSIFVAKDYDRTVLWLEGPSKCGKSSVQNAIADYLKDFNPALVGTLAKNEDRFSLTTIINARLVIYSDARDNIFFSRRDVLNITGKDIVFYEEKHKNPESKRIFAKIFVSSNYEPDINKQNDFETSRLLHIKIDKNKAKKQENKRKMTDLEFSNKLLEEMPYFLAKCKDAYYAK